MSDRAVLILGLVALILLVGVGIFLWWAASSATNYLGDAATELSQWTQDKVAATGSTFESWMAWINSGGPLSDPAQTGGASGSW